LFNNLIDMNRKISKVGITIVNSEGKNQVATNTVKAFLKAERLEEIIVDLRGTTDDTTEIEEIKKLCQEARFRKVCISVYNIQYLR